MTDTFTSHAAVSAPHAHVAIFDTTMRDGEQSPGASMSHDEKLQLAEMLEDLRVDVIEAGFPIASNGDYAAVRAVSERVKESVVCGLARAGAQDIERCADALKPARRGRIHTFLSTSPQHRDHILRMSPEEVIEAVIRSVTHARNLCDDVEWSAQDATRTERDVLRRCVEAAINAGATTINLPDTVGYTYPTEYGAMFRDIIENVPGADRVVLSAHCHNDLGLGVANSLAAIEAGARQVECAINGIGERAGNAALEEIVMALKVRGDALPVQHRRGRHPHRPGQPLRLGHHRLPSAVQQGDRRQERLRPRERHPPGRDAEEHRDLRDHAARGCRRAQPPTWSWASIRGATPSARS
jgi:2-isopropylmalate synthase